MPVRLPERLRTSSLQIGLLALVVFIGMCIYGLPRAPVILHLAMSANGGESGEIFYRRDDAAFTQQDGVAFHIADDGALHDYTIRLPAGARIDRIRIDPATRRSKVAIRSVEVRDREGIQAFDAHALFKARGRVNQARLDLDPNGQLLLDSMGGDPYFEFALHRPAGEPRPLLVLMQRLLAALAVALVFAGIGIGIARARAARSKAAGPPFQKLARHLDDELLTFTPAILATFSLLAITALVYVTLKLNQSSLEVWESVYPDAAVEQAIDLGSPRRIRSDEWKVQTPWVLNQVLAGSPNENHNLGGATTPLIASVPVADPIGLPNLKYAGFRFLDIERGFSWLWAYKSFGLVFSLLWLLLILTRGSLPASIVGTAWIYISSYTQWWFSSGLPEIMAAFALGTTGALYLLYSTRHLMIVIGAILLVLAATNLALTLYPPFIVSLGYLTVAIVVGYGLERDALARLVRGMRFRLFAGFPALVAIVIYGVWFSQTAAAAIAAMLDTVYPGKRIASSGGVPISKLMDGFFEAFRLGEGQFPRLPLSYNASEASGHLILLPLVVLLVPLARWWRREDALLPSIAAFCALAFAWIAVELPDPLNHVLQLTGWYAVTPKRAIMALGVGAIILCTVLLARMQASPPSARAQRVHWITVPLVVLAVAGLGWHLRQMDASFFTWQVIALGTLVSALIASGIARGNTASVAAGVAILALPAMSVNPLTSGLSSIMEKPVLAAARREGGAPGDRWMVIGDNFFAQGLKAVGLDVFAGTNYLPDMQAIDRLDPRHRYASVWNRYSTISVSSSPGIGFPQFSLIYPDQYRITVDVCSDAVRDIGITHVAYTVAVPDKDLACLEPIHAAEDSGVRMFRLKRP
jgi:hypothetical protein